MAGSHAVTLRDRLLISEAGGGLIAFNLANVMPKIKHVETPGYREESDFGKKVSSLRSHFSIAFIGLDFPSALPPSSR